MYCNHGIYTYFLIVISLVSVLFFSITIFIVTFVFIFDFFSFSLYLYLFIFSKSLLFFSLLQSTDILCTVSTKFRRFFDLALPLF